MTLAHENANGKVYIIEYLPEWASDPSMRQEFRKKLRKTLEESAVGIKYLLMSNNPNEWSAAFYFLNAEVGTGGKKTCI